jgi:hypothetical protein
VEIDSADARDRITRDSSRVLAIALGAVVALGLTFIVALAVVGELGGSLTPRDAMHRCLSTPPGIPERIDVTHVDLDWSWWDPPGYVCVYIVRGGVEEHSASADCLTAPGWCRSDP